MPADRRVSVTFKSDNQFLDKLSSVALSTHLHGCAVCTHYLHRRGNVLLVAVAGRALNRGVFASALLLAYMHRVHERHSAGLTLSTRPDTPDRKIGATTHIRVKRACNGCQKSLGDVTAAELEAAESGRRLPDVRLECGCWAEEQVA